MSSGRLASNTRLWPWAERALVSAGIGVMAGAFWGLVIGGVGGRIAMRVVFLTSDERVRGFTSDDGFEIGQITANSIVLLVFGGIVGAIGGMVYGALRLVWVGPRWLIVIAAGCAIGAAAGGSIVHPTGVDFVFLEPLWLTVGLFVALPAAWGVAVAATLESGRWFTDDLPARPQRWERGVAGWIVAVGLTAWGVVELIDDIQALTQL